ncbi:MAG TPA: phosphoglucosamine mutase [Deltaproteobacteria bacterium]|nr:phosphoglucosamine mutase [Deltaproteobacteria bacterium]HPR56332.1 phosphoglucosamine mutase [Deltaproteobacteria bacterium]HXK48614.1 phosphoglucosamine mutase [Deltaproteobacteria bacterium]
MGRLFGTDGIRGVANVHPMTSEMALKVGRAIAYLSRREGHTPRILIGKDTRVSGYMLESALVSGICSMGADALMVGPMTTPGVAFLTVSMRADAGIVISASHNPYQDNGIKIFSRDGFKLPDSKEEEIEKVILSDDLSEFHAEPEVVGKAYRIDDARGRYIVYLKRSFPEDCSLEGMKIVLDCANGATYRIAPEVFFELGAQVIPLFHEPDGKNINLGCGSQHPEGLAYEVVKNGADAGFAFDGDGDRVIAVDEKGDVLTGDHILALCALAMKRQGTLKNNLLVTTVMANLGLKTAMKEHDIDMSFTQVGDRYVLEEMLKKGSVIGGEQSGHIIYLNHHTSGDGIISALQVLRSMKTENRKLSELSKVMKVFPQKLINIDVKSKPDLDTIPEVKAAIEEVEAVLGEKGRVLVRYSGTQKMCRIMVEGPTEHETELYCTRIAGIIADRIG